MPSRSGPGPGIVLISASDTDLLAAQASHAAQASESAQPGGGPWRLANPVRTGVDDLPALLDGAFCVVLRLLGGRRSWP
ncbi:MAG: cobaltochelatase, CobN subunit, partial [Actinomycetia bacterium]|nr:cobaltochelatase, CobN subunit [Actinomycetes bacterium]